MIAYRLRDRVTIQSLTYAIDSATGARTDQWTTYKANVPANVSAASGKEYIASQAIQDTINTKIMMRYDANVIATMRIQFQSKIYDIKAILPDSLFRYMTLMCETGVNNG